MLLLSIAVRMLWGEAQNLFAPESTESSYRWLVKYPLALSISSGVMSRATLRICSLMSLCRVLGGETLQLRVQINRRLSFQPRCIDFRAELAMARATRCYTPHRRAVSNDARYRVRPRLTVCTMLLFPGSA